MKHILSTKQFLDKRVLFRIFQQAEEFERADYERRVPKPLRDKILACVFYEPSTRTRFSFESAALKLGGQVISTESAGHFSSAVKGETLEDSIRVTAGYADVIVLRHPEAGAAARAAAVSPVPMINAGDGDGEHPTQALLDFYTIQRELGRTDNLKIALVGDLFYGRTIHSLVYLLSLCENAVVFLAAPKLLRLPKHYKEFLAEKRIAFSEHEHLEEILPNVDVLYITRIQKERFPSEELYDSVKDSFMITTRLLQQLKGHAVVLHPLPRVREISAEVDSDARAAYFRQARYGLYVRMALLADIYSGA